jgi:peptidoglycan/xylan/chitin deacetylase (PgdA/CDA1 family)
MIMNNKSILTTVIILSFLMVTACSQKPELALEPNNTGTVTEEAPVDEPKLDSINDDDMIEEPIVDEPAAEDNAEVEPDVIPAQIEKTHYMNKNYFIVPSEPDGDKKVVLLTFDDGPKEQELIDQMIEVLDKHQAKAIFFVNGYRIKQNPDLLTQLHEAGQIIGNHAWDHINLRNLTEQEVKQQIGDVQVIVEELTGSRPEFFRPPFGAANEGVKQIVSNENMLFMTWSNGSEDWVKAYQTPEGVTQRVMEQLAPGSNILMHELPWTVEALDNLLTKISEEGYSFIDPRAIEIQVQQE